MIEFSIPDELNPSHEDSFVFNRVIFKVVSNFFSHVTSKSLKQQILYVILIQNKPKASSQFA